MVIRIKITRISQAYPSKCRRLKRKYIVNIKKSTPLSLIIILPYWSVGTVPSSCRAGLVLSCVGRMNLAPINENRHMGMMHHIITNAS